VNGDHLLAQIDSGSTGVNVHRDAYGVLTINNRE